MEDQTRKQDAARWIARGVRALKARKPKLARQYLLKARQLDPQNPDIYMWLAATTRDPDRRRALLQQALTIDPDHAKARRALESLEVQDSVQAVAPDAQAVQALPEDESAVPEMESHIEEVPAESVPSPPDLQEMAPAQQAKAGRCPQCGAVMRVHPESGAAYCVFCGYGMADAGEQVAITASRIQPERPWSELARARRCLTCEAVSIPPAGSPDDAPCPLCQQTLFEPAHAALPLPDTYFPFRVSEAEAAIAIEDAGKSGLGRLFRGRREISRPRPLYLPLWVFSGAGHIEYEFPGFEGQGGLFTEPYQLIPVHCIPQIEGKLLRLASDLDLGEAVRYEAEAGQEAFVLLPGISLQASLHEARGLMLRDARQKAREQVRPPTPKAPHSDRGMLTRGDAIAGAVIASASRGSAAMTITASDVKDLSYQLMLLPIWINEVREGSKLQMGFVNGFTGRAAVGALAKRRR